MAEINKNNLSPRRPRRINSDRLLFWAFPLSLLLHFCLAGFVYVIPPRSHHRDLSKTTVELVDSDEIQKRRLPPLNKEEKKQLVEQNEKPLNDEIDPNAKHLSKSNQRVAQETKAAAVGRFKNSSSPPPLPKTSSPAPAVSSEKLMREKGETLTAMRTTADGVEVDRKSKPSKKTAQATVQLQDLIPKFRPGAPQSHDGEPTDQSQARLSGDGPAASDDHLKDVKTGMQTLLSTREFVYYTYYNRIKDKLRQYWEPMIKMKIEHLLRSGRHLASTGGDRITQIVIVLDQKGTLIRVQVIGPSGVRDLDEAAVDAFRAAAPFPNPPKGIIDPDGTIKIRWDFVLEAMIEEFPSESFIATM